MTELIRARLAEYLRDRLGETLCDLKASRASPRRFSVTTFLQANTDRGSHRFVAKQIRKHPANAFVLSGKSQAVVEFEILGRLHSSFEGVANCSVPRPVAVLAEIDAYVTEFVEGHLLAEDLRYARCFTGKAGFQKLAKNYQLCGCWLRHFQEATGKRAADVGATEAVMSRIESRLRLIEELRDPRCGKDFAKRVRDFLEGLLTELSGSKVTLTGRHGDFGPWNILVGPNGITVLDFFGYQHDLMAIDVLKMLMHFRFSRLRPLRSARRNAVLRDNFLKGYGALPEVSRAECLLPEAMHRICGVSGALQARQSRRLDSIHLRRCLDDHLAWFLSDGDRPSLWPTT